ncbi:MAG TPA: glutaredoxin family protein [Pseudomonadales bacterium]|nr:glutaredoxin family protein [Pseudomonadales bacterium]
MRQWVMFGIVLSAAVLLWKSQSPSHNASAADIAALASAVRADEIVIYTTSTCSYCKQALHWLDQQGFSYTDCNMSTTPRCEQEFLIYGAKGTPYLVVRGHHMKNGFDSDEFIHALKQKG